MTAPLAPRPITESAGGPGSIAARARSISEVVAGPLADEVDREACYPEESMSALASAGMLAVGVPEEIGGEGAGLREVADAVRILAQGCSSTSMIYAMHQIQVWCLVRHGATATLQDVLRRVAADRLLLASATSEVTIGGDVRSSLCAVEIEGDRYRLEKQAPVISYGEYAGAVLTTARRTPDSAPSDQVLVCCEGPGLHLEPVDEWDTMGFRGTCSRGFRLRAEGGTEQILTASFGDISTQTMLPVSHVLWASVWLGIAEAAAGLAHGYVRKQARERPGATTPAATRLAELSAVLQQFRGSVSEAIRRYELIESDPGQLGDIGFAVAMNGLKLSSSTLVADIATRALAVCGMSGYRHNSPFSMSRLLRDAHGAALMVNNDRLVANNAHLLLANRRI